MNPEAQEAYLRVIYWGDKNDPKKYDEYLQEAVRKDLGYPLAMPRSAIPMAC